MNKKSVFMIIGGLAIFNFLFFLLCGTDRNASSWVAYGFIHIAYLLMVLVPVFAKNRNDLSVLDAVVKRISLIYFIIQFVLGIVIIAINSEGFMFSIVVQMILLAVYLGLLFSNLMANDKTNKNKENQSKEVLYVKSAAMKVKLLLDKNISETAKRELESLYDSINSSPTKSNDMVRDTENRIMIYIDELSKAVYLNDSDSVIRISGMVKDLVKERNSMLRL